MSKQPLIHGVLPRFKHWGIVYVLYAKRSAVFVFSEWPCTQYTAHQPKWNSATLRNRDSNQEELDYKLVMKKMSCKA